MARNRRAGLATGFEKLEVLAVACPDLHAVGVLGDKLDVRVTNVDAKTRRLGLSIKAREIAEEKEAVEQYGSSDSGASLGDILGAALKSDD